MSSTALTLYSVEDHYLALVETEAMVPAELEAEFKLELAQALLHATDKREGVVQFLLWLDDQLDSTRRELERLTKRKETFKNTIGRMRKYVVDVIKGAGVDEKGKYRKLEARTALMFLRALPASVEILHESEVPDEYKNINLTMPMDLWRRMCDVHPELRGDMHEVMNIDVKSVAVDKEAVKSALQRGEDVPGADLRLAGHDQTLVIK